MKTIKKSVRAFLSTFCILSMMAPSAFAAPVVTTSSDTYTWYDGSGTPLAPGSRIDLARNGGVLLNNRNEPIGAIYLHKDDALRYNQRAVDGCNGGSYNPNSPTSEGDPCMRAYKPSPLFPNIGVAGISEIHAEFVAKLNVNDSMDPMKGVKPIQGGPFNSSYNGIGVSEEAKALDDDAYLAKSMEMTSFLWGIAEVGEKLCKPVGDAHPKSLFSWWKMIKNYIAAEKLRDELVKRRIEILKTKMDGIISDKSTNSNLQLKAIEFQIESLNISIDSIAGSTMFGLDGEAATSKSTARLPWREGLLVAAHKGSEENKKENKENHEVYDLCLKGIDGSKSVAAEACKRTKKEKVCTTPPSENEGSGAAPEVCEEKIVKDPVPGSCEMAEANLPDLLKGPLKDMATIYYTNPIPSKQINERLIRVGKTIDNLVTGYPVSNDSKFNWTTPLDSCKEKPMMVKIKYNGIICPANASDKSYDKAKVESMGSTIGEGSNNVEPNYNLPAVTKVSDSAKTFLGSMGISGDALKETTTKFQDNWNTTDLYLGQPILRDTYFSYVQGVIGTMISADNAKLGQLLATREKLNKLYEDTKKLYQPTQNGGGSGGGGSNPSLAGGSVPTPKPGAAGGASPFVVGPGIGAPGGTQPVTAIKTLTPAANNSVAVNAGTKVTNGAQANSFVPTYGSTSVGSATAKTKASANGVRGAENGRTVSAVSAATRDQIEKITKSANQTQSKIKSIAKDSDMPAINESEIVANISESMGSTMNESFINAHSSSLMSSFDGGSAIMRASVEARDAQSAVGRSSSKTVVTSKMNPPTRTQTNYKSSMSSRTSFAQMAKNSMRGQEVALKGNGAESATDGDGSSYRPVVKPALFDQISKRYNSSRERLGMEALKEEE